MLQDQHLFQVKTDTHQDQVAMISGMSHIGESCQSVVSLERANDPLDGHPNPGIKAVTPPLLVGQGAPFPCLSQNTAKYTQAPQLRAATVLIIALISKNRRLISQHHAGERLGFVALGRSQLETPEQIALLVQRQMRLITEEGTLAWPRHPGRILVFAGLLRRRRLAVVAIGGAAGRAD